MRTAILISTMLLCVGCTDPKRQDGGELSKRERDSIIGESGLPGARGIRGAMRAADSAEARQQRAAEIN